MPDPSRLLKRVEAVFACTLAAVVALPAIVVLAACLIAVWPVAVLLSVGRMRSEKSQKGRSRWNQHLPR